eukprot:Hpha_TRINITY_DN4389_c0_g1::TRINITY_DN4389_c0_g1_i1::g.50045::m.50045
MTETEELRRMGELDFTSPTLGQGGCDSPTAAASGQEKRGSGELTARQYSIVSSPSGGFENESDCVSSAQSEDADWDMLEGLPTGTGTITSVPLWLRVAVSAVAPAQGWGGFARFVERRVPGGMTGLRKQSSAEMRACLEGWAREAEHPQMHLVDAALEQLVRWTDACSRLPPARTSNGVRLRAPSLPYNAHGCPRAEMEPREIAPNCRGCQRVFTMVRRPHRCRACGGRFCASCTRDTLCLPYYQNEPQRVCGLCRTAAWKEMRSNPGTPVHANPASVPAQIKSAVVHGAQLCKERMRRADFCPGCGGHGVVLGRVFNEPFGADREAFDEILDDFLWLSYRRG